LNYKDDDRKNSITMRFGEDLMMYDFGDSIGLHRHRLNLNVSEENMKSE
jgi:hypothetical protein